jgi:hypothetical protein
MFQRTMNKVKRGHKKINKYWFFLPITFRVSLCFFYSPSYQRPLTLTPTARFGCGLYSLVLLIKRTFHSRKNHGFYLRSLPTHHPATWPITMEDEGKSGLQTSFGDAVFLIPLCCAFGIPELFFVCSSIRRSTAPSSPTFLHRCTCSDTYIAILRNGVEVKT